MEVTFYATIIYKSINGHHSHPTISILRASKESKCINTFVNPATIMIIPIEDHTPIKKLSSSLIGNYSPSCSNQSQRSKA